MAYRRIAVLTSGGDAPGMNAAVRAVTRTALEQGVEVYGVYRGYNGLISGDFLHMSMRTVSNVMQRGGTFLYSARSPEFRTEEGMQKAIEQCRKNGIEGLVVIGGDGSFRGARDITARGLPCICIPGTIDNDISCCDETIGYDTALNTAQEMVDRLRDTTESHDRCSVVEIMGRNAGYLPLNVAVACGATSVLVPEMPYDFERDVIQRIERANQSGKKNSIIVVAEGVGHVSEMAEEIERRTGIESRATILGHVQRGGSPTVRDRVLASRMGYYAVQLLLSGASNRVVATQKQQLCDFDIKDALEMKKPFDEELYRMAMDISL